MSHRLTHDYTNDNNFVLPKNLISPSNLLQYSQLYRHRLASLTPLIKNPNAEAFPYCATVLELKPETDCCIVGTIYTTNKQTIMDNVGGVLGTRKPVQRVPTSYWLEDLSGRIKLDGDCFEGLCTGAVIGALGRADSRGIFKLKSIIMPGLPAKIDEPLQSQGGALVCFASGFEFGLDQDTLSREMLFNFLAG